MLAAMRIGTLPEEERVTVDDNPYANDPSRDDAIRVLSSTPFNGEAPHSVLSQHITPTLHHFKRNHMPVPDALPDAYELQARLLPPAVSHSCCHYSAPACTCTSCNVPPAPVSAF